VIQHALDRRDLFVRDARVLRAGDPFTPGTFELGERFVVRALHDQLCGVGGAHLAASHQRQDQRNQRELPRGREPLLDLCGVDGGDQLVETGQRSPDQCDLVGAGVSPGGAVSGERPSAVQVALIRPFLRCVLQGAIGHREVALDQRLDRAVEIALGVRMEHGVDVLSTW
jgi:hypothetical protein